METTLPPLLACHDCDALYTTPDLAGAGRRVLCSRCGATLFSSRPGALAHAVAFALAAVVLFVAANAFPFLVLRADLRLSTMTLAEGVSGLAEHNYLALAIGVAVFTLAAPAVTIGGLLYLLGPLLSGRRLPGSLTLCRWVYGVRRWNMVEVYLLGVLVSLLKLGSVARLSLGISFWAFAGLIVCLTTAVGAVDPREVWLRLEEAGPRLGRR